MVPLAQLAEEACRPCLRGGISTDFLSMVKKKDAFKNGKRRKKTSTGLYLEEPLD